MQRGTFQSDSQDNCPFLLFRSQHELAEFLVLIKRDRSAAASLGRWAMQGEITKFTLGAPLEDDAMAEVVLGLLGPSCNQSDSGPGDNAIVALGFRAAYPLSTELWRSRSPARDKRILSLIYRIVMRCDNYIDVEAIIGELEFGMKTGRRETVNEALGQMIDQVRNDLRGPPAGSI